MNLKKEYRIKLVSKEFLNEDTCYLGFECPEIAASAVPGQFVNISAGTVFLKRPFGIASVNKENGTFNIGVKVVGKGTAEISQFEPGLFVDCLGPLGNGFDFEGYDNVILTGGGTGVFHTDSHPDRRLGGAHGGPAVREHDRPYVGTVPFGCGRL